MNDQARACAAYFQSRPGYRRILSELLKKYRSYGRPAGTIRLDDATQEECDAARSIFGRPFSPPLRFHAAQFEAALQELRFGKVSLKEVLESYFNTEIRTNSELREAENSRFTTMMTQILKQTDNSLCIRWLQTLKGSPGRRISIASPGGRKGLGWDKARSVAGLPELGPAGTAYAGHGPPGCSQCACYLRSPCPRQRNIVWKAVFTSFVLPFRAGSTSKRGATGQTVL